MEEQKPNFDCLLGSISGNRKTNVSDIEVYDTIICEPQVANQELDIESLVFLTAVPADHIFWEMDHLLWVYRSYYIRSIFIHELLSNNSWNHRYRCKLNIASHLRRENLSDFHLSRRCLEVRHKTCQKCTGSCLSATFCIINGETRNQNIIRQQKRWADL